MKKQILHFYYKIFNFYARKKEEKETPFDIRMEKYISKFDRNPKIPLQPCFSINILLLPDGTGGFQYDNDRINHPQTVKERFKEHKASFSHEEPPQRPDPTEDVWDVLEKILNRGGSQVCNTTTTNLIQLWINVVTMLIKIKSCQMCRVTQAA